MSGEITSIMIRKLGGWKMISVAKWIGYKPERRTKLLAQDHVQFFVGKVVVPPETAQVMLGLAEPTFGEPGGQPTPTQTMGAVPVQEVSVARPVAVTYRRFVWKDSRWVVLRNAENSEAQELYSVRGRSSPSAYDVRSSDGMRVLSADLLADALGVDQDGLAVLSSDSIGHFRSEFVEPVLGTSEWETSAAQIWAVLERNPYLNIVKAGW